MIKTAATTIIYKGIVMPIDHPDFCAQADNIVNIGKTLERMERGQDSIVRLLETVSSQNARLDHLEEHSERVYGEVNEIFTRLRDVEVNAASSGPTVRQQFHETIDSLSRQLDKLDHFFRLTTSKAALIVYGVIAAMIVSGTLLDVMYHFETLKAIFNAIHGGS